MLASLLLFTPVNAAAAGETEAPTPPGRTLRIAGGVSMGLGAALMLPMALGISEGNRAASEIKRYNARALAANRRFTPEEFAAVEDAYRRSQRMQSLAISTGVVGGLLFVGGLTLHLVGARRSLDSTAAKRRVRATPTFGATTVGLSIFARF